MSERSKKEVHSPLRDLAGFILLAAALFSLLILLSYNPLDPSLHTTVQGAGISIHNYGGIVGSYLSDILMQLLGYASFLVPIALLGLAWGIVFRPQIHHIYLRIVGFGAFVLSGTLFLALAAGDAARLPPWGGLLGHLLRKVLIHYVGEMGATLLSCTALAAAAVLTAGVTFAGFVEKASMPFRPSQYEKKGAMAKGIRKWKTWLKNFLEMEEEELERGLDAIRSVTEPEFEVSEKIKIAGEDVRADDVDQDFEPEEEAAEIPIVIPKRGSGAKQEMPQFHSMMDEPAPKVVVTQKERPVYTLPSTSLLDTPQNQDLAIDRDELFTNAQLLERKLKDFGVYGKVVEVQPGPVVTMYEFEPAPGVKVNQITRLGDDLALALKAVSVRITPIPGKAVIGIEVANRTRQVVYLREILDDVIFSHHPSRLTLALGKDISGTPVVSDLRRMPHLLVAGATGSGKSVSVNSMILSILYRATPDEVRMILVDPKMLELSLYDNIPHLLLPVVTDANKAAISLRWAVLEMERRYRLMADLGDVRNIEGYNRSVGKAIEAHKKEVEVVKEEAELPLSGAAAEEGKKDEHTGPLPYIMIVIDELADLMMVSSREVEESIMRLAQMARAAGIHLILATQRPSVDVITGVIKANMPTRISFQVSSKIDSRTILDANGAETLLGAGDMLLLPPGSGKLSRIHGAFVSDAEVKRVTDFWKDQGAPDYNLDILKVKTVEEQIQAEEGEDGEMYRAALEVAKLHRVASISMIQRKLRIGYNRAARLVERMEEEGYLAPGEVGKPREVRMTRFEG